MRVVLCFRLAHKFHDARVGAPGHEPAPPAQHK
jgi:hypothetical protein